MSGAEKYINEHGKECYRGVTTETEFSKSLFHVVEMHGKEDSQFALHTNIGSLTVLNRRTGFGWIDTETGYRDPSGAFWLASGGCDVMNSGSKTIVEAIAWVKSHANTCNPDQVVAPELDED